MTGETYVKRSTAGDKVAVFQNAMVLHYAQGQLKKERKYPVSSHPGRVEFSFFKSAHMDIAFSSQEPGLVIGPMQSHLAVNRGREGQVIHYGNKPYSMLDITIPESNLKDLISLCPQKENTGVLDARSFYCHRGGLTSQMLQVFNQLAACPLEEGPHLLYAQAKCMELIALKLIQVKTSPLGGQVSEEDRKIAGRAASILTADLTSPPCLDTLARLVGVSLSRLKQIFPKVYGTTPFGFLRSQRLAMGRKLIQQAGISASEAALRVGYSDLSPFHRAFVKEYGIRPGDCRS